MLTAISVSTVVYHTDIEMLKAHIQSIRVAAAHLLCAHKHEVLLTVIDNSESERYFEELRNVLRQFDGTAGFRVFALKTEKNIGYGSANNAVRDGLNSTYHLVINPDVIVAEDSLLLAFNYMESNPSVGMLSPTVVNAEGEPGHVVKRYPDCLTLLLRYLGRPVVSKYFMKKLHHYQCEDLHDINPQVELIGGCFLFMRTALFHQLNGFDPRFFMYFEDFDFCMRLRKLADIAFVPSVKVCHFGGDVGRKSRQHHLFFVASALRFYSLHGWRFL